MALAVVAAIIEIVAVAFTDLQIVAFMASVTITVALVINGLASLQSEPAEVVEYPLGVAP